LFWFHQNKHTPEPEIIVLITQAQNFCSRKSCHYTGEASLQKNNFLIKIEMQICLLPKPIFFVLGVTGETGEMQICLLPKPIFFVLGVTGETGEDLTSKKTSLPALLGTVAEVCARQA